MNVAIVSDSHGAVDRLEIMLGRVQEAGITHVIHAGDFAAYPVVDIFKKFPNLEIYISRGNWDVNDELVEEINALPNVKVAEVIQVELEGVKIAASHYEGIAQKIGLEPEEILFIDDAQSNLDVAKKSGMAVIQYQSNDQVIKDIEKA